MECHARFVWKGRAQGISCYQSYSMLLVEGKDTDQVQLVCQSKAADVLQLTVHSSGVRRVVRDHVADGRASILFTDQQQDLCTIDISDAPPDALRIFTNRLLFLSSSSSSSTPQRGLKRKMNMSFSRRHSYGARMITASLAKDTSNCGSSPSAYPVARSNPTHHHTTPTHPHTTPTHDRSSYSRSAPPAKRSLLLDPYSPPTKRRPPFRDLTDVMCNSPSTTTTTATTTTTTTTAEPARKSMRGFANLGNTCYMNSVLQSLLGLMPFTADLVHSDIARVVSPTSLCRLLYLLAKCKISNDSITSQRILLKKIKSAICNSASRFAGFNEQDAHELLSHCLDQLRCDVNSLHDSHTDPCPVEANFKSIIVRTVSCSDCGHTTTSRETMFDYTLQLPQWTSVHFSQQASLQQLIDEYFQTEDVEYSCSQCQCRSSRLSHHLVQLPRVLVLTLKRYNSHPRGKRVDAVRIPRHLIVGPLCSTSVQPPPVVRDMRLLLQDGLSSMTAVCNTSTAGRTNAERENTLQRTSVPSTSVGFTLEGVSEEEQLRMALELSLNESIECDGESDDDIVDTATPEPSEVSMEHTYRLVSIISHVGRASSTGHYVSDVYVGGTGHSNWLSYNDSLVTPTSEDTVRQSRKTTGYIFFYMHRNTYQKLSHQ